jgi:lysophospholipid acyltransferase (LPLAT)-like uncharacterized protein
MSQPARHDIRGGRKAELAGRLAAVVMKAWAATLRVELDDRCGLSQGRAPQPVIFALWHDQVFCLPPLWWRHGGRKRRAVVLTSASKDGAVVASAMAAFGLDAVRGSSSRRGATALVALKRALDGGSDTCITPDGPRGPRHVLQPGLVKLAQTTGAPIVPIRLECPSAWRLRTWDRLVIPHPFSRVHVIFGDPITVPPTSDEDGFEAQRQRVEDHLLSICQAS